MSETYKLDEMCEMLGKSVPYVRRLQAQIGVTIPPKGEGYSEAYVRFMRKVISLRAFNVPLDDISQLLTREKRILELLHIDAMSDSLTWYMAEGDHPVQSETHLLLTGHDLGFPVSSGAIQCNLDFRERDPELFGGHEMGEDVRRVIEVYLRILKKIDERVQRERAVLLDALAWAGAGLMPE